MRSNNTATDRRHPAPPAMTQSERQAAAEWQAAKFEAAEAGAVAYAAALQHLDALHAALDADARYEG